MAIARTTHGGAVTNTSATTTTQSVTVTAVTGEAIIVAVGTVNTTSNAPTDNATGSSNTYVQLGSIATNTERITLWGCASSKSNVTSVTATYTASRASVAVSTYTGVAGFNQSNTTTGTGSASPGTATVPNTLNPGSVSLAGFANKGTATWSANAAGNLRDNIAGGGTTTPGVAIVDSIALADLKTCTVNESASNVWAGTIIELYSALLTSEDVDPQPRMKHTPYDPEISVWQ
jgi:hypothetical protein